MMSNDRPVNNSTIQRAYLLVTCLPQCDNCLSMKEFPRCIDIAECSVTANRMLLVYSITYMVRYIIYLGIIGLY